MPTSRNRQYLGQLSAILSGVAVTATVTTTPDAVAGAGASFLNLNRHLSVSGLSSSSGPNYNIGGTTAPKILMVTPRTGEQQLVITELLLYIDDTTAAQNNFFSASALATGLRMAVCDTQGSVKANGDLIFAFSPGTGAFPRSCRELAAAFDEQIYPPSAFTPGSTFIGKLTMDGRRGGPIRLLANESIRFTVLNDTPSSLFGCIRAKGFILPT